MNSAVSNSDFNLALVSAPWPLYNRPSIQLGALKAYVNAKVPDIRVDNYHLYLHVAAAIGYRQYHAISERTWLAECVYASLLYPERLKRIEAFFGRQARGKPDLNRIDFKALTSKVATVTGQFVESVDWSKYGLIGFSICLCQLSATLYVIQELKKRWPGPRIVVGGSVLAAKTAHQLLQVFPGIQYAIIGEGERPLVDLVDCLRRHGTYTPDTPIQGLVSAVTPSGHHRWSASGCQLKSLANLPRPDFDDYFDSVRRLPPHKQFFPTLAAEISRGCWWQRSVGQSQSRGCVFCNLNLQWQGYRHKSAQQIVSEIDELTTRYQLLHVALVDNLIPIRDAGRIFESLTQLDKDLLMFCEIRADTPRSTLEVMYRAGVREVQIGVEALSYNLLKKINKGVSAIQNLAALKQCEEIGLQHCSNLILEFPGSSADDVRETLETLDYASYYRPMRGVRFWLGLESPVWQDPDRYGILARFNHPNWSHLFPRSVRSRLTFIIQSYRGDRRRQEKLWKPVSRQLALWQANYRKLRRSPESPPILSYRDGRDFLIIRQLRPEAEPLTHRLTGTSRQIYLYCREIRAFREIANQFPDFDPATINGFLRSMIDKRLMYGENKTYLSLAVAVRPRRSS